MTAAPVAARRRSTVATWPTSARRSAALPARARIVIIGGGVGGASVAHHLAERGERDVLLVERAELTSGSTFHSAGLVGQLRADPALTRMNAWSAALYRRLEEAGGDGAPGWVESGSLRLASSPQRLEEIRRQAAWARRAGLPLELVSAEEAAGAVPADVHRRRPRRGVHPDRRPGRPGAAVLRAGRVGPRRRGDDRAAHPRHGDHHARGPVTGVRTDRGDVECEVVVDCGGMFAAEIARLAGVRVPIVPMSHQYVVTEPFLPAGTGPLPSLRDPDLLVYYRQEVEGLVMGGYERRSAPFTATATSFDAVPADFNGRLLPADWDRFAEIVENAQVRVPALADTGVRTMVNGPEGFTPDNEFCLGETDVGGFFVAAGFCAHGIAGAGGIGQVMAAWILDGDPGLDVWHMDVRRFGPEYRSPGYTLARVVENYESYYDIRPPGSQRRAGRPLRTSPAYPWHAAHGAVFGEKAGWERVEYYADGAGRGAADDAAAAGLGGARLVALGAARAPGRPRGRGAVRRVVLRQDRDHRSGGRRPSSPTRSRDRVDAAAGVARVHPGARRPRRRRDGRHGDPRGARRVPGGHRHGVGAPRPGVAARPGPGDGERGADRGRQRGAGRASGCGVRGPRRAGPAHAARTCRTRRSRT